ncbi:MAG: hypothetical protein HN816_00855, partial [Gammaproteobacteria bacterium]|nr:hypothetical protein [Gammaproteobacteria bacterium]
KAEIIEDKPKQLVYSYLLVPEDTEQAARLRQWLRELDAMDQVTVVVSHDLGDIENSGLAEWTGRP